MPWVKKKRHPYFRNLPGLRHSKAFILAFGAHQIIAVIRIRYLVFGKVKTTTRGPDGSHSQYDNQLHQKVKLGGRTVNPLG